MPRNLTILPPPPPPPQVAGERLSAVRLKAYLDVTQTLVSDQILSQFVFKSIPVTTQVWAFKKRLACQLAMSACVSYVLHIGGRSPNKLLVARNTGSVFQNDFHPRE